jgi:hypothetical protein
MSASRNCVLLLAFVSFCIPGLTQQDSLSIRLSSFTKLEQSAEKLYIAVFIKSKNPSSIVIDNTQHLILCWDTRGVKLVSERLVDSCFVDGGGADCDPDYAGEEEGDPFKLTPKMLGPYQEYEYTFFANNLPYLSMKPTSSTSPGRTLIYRFRLELPYSVNGKAGLARSAWCYLIR